MVHIVSHLNTFVQSTELEWGTFIYAEIKALLYDHIHVFTECTV